MRTPPGIESQPPEPVLKMIAEPTRPARLPARTRGTRRQRPDHAGKSVRPGTVFADRGHLPALRQMTDSRPRACAGAHPERSLS